MALTQTSLAAACGATDLLLSITSTSTGFPPVGVTQNPGQLMQVDGEFMYIVQVPVAGSVKVRSRGAEGTQALAHDILAAVITSPSPGADFPVTPVGHYNPRPLGYDDTVSVGQNGVIAVPTKNTTVNLVKATALASTTLAAPSVAANGLRVTITSQTAAAHVITATSLFGDGATGSPHTTATYGAFKGASMVLEAANAIWNVISNNGVVFT